jgi:hypothetical protein
MRTFYFLAISSIIFFASSCSSNSKLAKQDAYKGIYDEKPLSVLIMPPINRSTNVRAKEYFHSTLNVPIANAGYYVIPPFLSMEILKRESAYDADLFLNSRLSKFREIFGADVALFTIIHEWRKSTLKSNIYVEVEYIFKSTQTNEILYNRKGAVTYDTSANATAGIGLTSILVNMIASAINTAVTKHVLVARACNQHTFKDLPAGKYNPVFGTDGLKKAGKQEFKVKLN